MEDIYNMVSCSQKRLEENAMLEKKLVKFRPFSEESLSKNSDVNFYTELPNLKMLRVIFDHVKRSMVVSQFSRENGQPFSSL